MRPCGAGKLLIVANRERKWEHVLFPAGVAGGSGGTEASRPAALNRSQASHTEAFPVRLGESPEISSKNPVKIRSVIIALGANVGAARRLAID